MTCVSLQKEIVLGLILWMGLVKMPSVKDYWRIDFLYCTRVPEVMSRSYRFELILGFFTVETMKI